MFPTLNSIVAKPSVSLMKRTSPLSLSHILDDPSAIRPKDSTKRRKRAKRSTCRFEMCNKAARKRGFCFTHGGRDLCSSPGCQKCSHQGGYCIAHGGGKRCGVQQCPKAAQVGGKCFAHGGGQRCKQIDCSSAVKQNGYCVKHNKENMRKVR